MKKCRKRFAKSREVSVRSSLHQEQYPNRCPILPVPPQRAAQTAAARTCENHAGPWLVPCIPHPGAQQPCRAQGKRETSRRPEAGKGPNPAESQNVSPCPSVPLHPHQGDEAAATPSSPRTPRHKWRPVGSCRAGRGISHAGQSSRVTRIPVAPCFPASLRELLPAGLDEPVGQPGHSQSREGLANIRV